MKEVKNGSSPDKERSEPKGRETYTHPPLVGDIISFLVWWMERVNKLKTPYRQVCGERIVSSISKTLEIIVEAAFGSRSIRKMKHARSKVEVARAWLTILWKGQHISDNDYLEGNKRLSWISIQITKWEKWEGRRVLGVRPSVPDGSRVAKE